MQFDAPCPFDLPLFTGRSDVISTDFADLAALIARHALHVVEGDGVDPLARAEAFWVVCRRRRTMWSEALDAAEANEDAWPRLASEHMVTELLTEVWGAVLLAACEHRKSIRGWGLVRQSLGWRLETRNRILQRVARDCGDRPQAAVIDLLRRKVDRWSNLLVGALATRYHLSESGFFRIGEPDEPVCDPTGSELHQEVSWSLTTAAIRMSLPRTPLTDSGRNRHHLELFSLVLTGLPYEAFAATGVVRRDRLRRIYRTIREERATSQVLRGLVGAHRARATAVPRQPK
jgi:hypothetical protein